MIRRFCVVDAFTSQPFRGNPAAVVLDAAGLDGAQMQAIAAEFNLSETTFVLPYAADDKSSRTESGDSPDAWVHFRWFSPSMEVDMCGHATLAAIHAMIECGVLRQAASPRRSDPAQRRENCGPGVSVIPAEQAWPFFVGIHTKGGRLTAFVEPLPGDISGCLIWLELVRPLLRPFPREAATVLEALGLSASQLDATLPPIVSQDGDLLLFVDGVVTVNSVRPDFHRLHRALEGAGLRGLSLATTGTLADSIALQSRYFAPGYGIDEDAVTGSVHGPLAAYLVMQGRVRTGSDGIAGMMCVQGKAGGRSGLIWALVRCENQEIVWVRIGGQAVTTMKGTLHV